MRAFAIKLCGAKAQVSLEFLVLFVAFMAFLSVWVSLILTVAEGVGESIEFSNLCALGADIREAADAVCLMGPGSSRVVEPDFGAEVGFSGRTLTVSSGGMKVVESMRCESARASMKLNIGGELRIENREGKLDVTNR